MRPVYLSVWVLVRVASVPGEAVAVFTSEAQGYGGRGGYGFISGSCLYLRGVTK